MVMEQKESKNWKNMHPRIVFHQTTAVSRTEHLNCILSHSLDRNFRQELKMHFYLEPENIASHVCLAVPAFRAEPSKEGNATATSQHFHNTALPAYVCLSHAFFQI